MGHVLGSRKRSAAGAIAIALVMAMLVAACGGSSGSSGKGAKGGSGASGGTSGGALPGLPVDKSKPIEGGSMSLAIEADTTTGWCLPEATLAIAGIEVARSIYDYLAVPDAKNNYVPFLADKITPNADFTSWSIHVRPGITFHDGTPLTGQVVLDNLNAYWGKLKARSPILFIFVFDDLKALTLVDPMTVRVDMIKPWVTFPSHLYEYGRLGIMAEKQINDTKGGCSKNLDGTGPFMLKEWVPNDHMTLVKNPNYWRKDTFGQKLPYLDTLTFKPTPDPSALENGLQSHAFDLAVTDSTDVIYDLQSAVSGGQLNLTKSAVHPEIGYTIFNTRIAPFDNILARQAFAYAFNKPLYNKLRQHGLLTEGEGPFGPGTLGYLAKTGLPSYNLAKAKSLVKQYEKESGQKLTFTLTIPNDSSSVRSAEVVQGFMKAAGIKMDLKPEEQQTQIADVIYSGLTPKTYQAAGWRNHPGFDPDTQWVWWHCAKPPAGKGLDNAPAPPHIGDGPATEAGNNCDNLVNFSGFNDAKINKDMETGRESSDEPTRQAAYEDMSREFAKQLWSAWGFFTLWTIPSQPNVRGVLGPNLPTATSPDAVGNDPFTGLASGDDVSGLWLKK